MRRCTPERSGAGRGAERCRAAAWARLAWATSAAARGAAGLVHERSEPRRAAAPPPALALPASPLRTPPPHPPARPPTGGHDDLG